jgi:hypothetical protein
MVVGAIGLARLPVMRAMLDDVVALIDEIRIVFATDAATTDGHGADVAQATSKTS